MDSSARTGFRQKLEHGIGKLKREYLRELYGDEHLREMVALKRAFDPAGILGRGTMFDEEYINRA